MHLYLTCILSFCLTFGISLSQGLPPRIILHLTSGRNLTYEGVSDEDFTKEKLFPDEKIVGVFARGLWLFYDHKDFNWNNGRNEQVKDNASGNGLDIEWVYNEGSEKLYTFYNKDLIGSIGSFRYVGDKNDFRKSGVQLYMGAYFSGPDRFLSETQFIHLPFSKSKSTIIIGDEVWTLFTRKRNLNMQNLCFLPNGDNPTLIPDYSTNVLTYILKHLSSVRKGRCSPYDQLYSDDKQYHNHTQYPYFKY